MLVQSRAGRDPKGPIARLDDAAHGVHVGSQGLPLAPGKFHQHITSAGNHDSRTGLSERKNSRFGVSLGLSNFTKYTVPGVEYSAPQRSCTDPDIAIQCLANDPKLW